MVKRMNDDLEGLSAAHDGEGRHQDLLRLLDAIDNDPEIRKQQSIYHLIGDALRTPDSPTLGTDVRASVMRSVAREPVPAIPADAVVQPFKHRRVPQQVKRSAFRTAGASAAAVAAVALISALLWRGGVSTSDPIVSYVIFEQPRNNSQLVQVDGMPAELVDYLLAHRQNSAAGTMSAGSALIRANGSDNLDNRTNANASPRSGDMEWVRLWDNRPVYVTPRAVER